MPLRRDGDVAVDLSRSTLTAALGWGRGGASLTAGAGLALYRRATVDVPTGLAATDATYAAALIIEPALAWRQGLVGRWSVEVTVGVDVVAGAPELVVQRAGTTEVLADLATVQPRLSAALTVELP
ncbi:MAG: hypothetical protein H6709_24620 [Kofleriaceae bacterium]|nr:hypothetical protein [Kofleriaceae bacterium]MCB9575273.1 hypothetical protein [Kofleriaceae bacterium]